MGLAIGTGVLVGAAVEVEGGVGASLPVDTSGTGLNVTVGNGVGLAEGVFSVGVGGFVDSGFVDEG